MPECTGNKQLEEGDIFNVEMVREMAQGIRNLQPRIKPSECNCGKHRAHFILTSREQAEHAFSLLENDQEYLEYLGHLRACGYKKDTHA